MKIQDVYNHCYNSLNLFDFNHKPDPIPQIAQEIFTVNYSNEQWQAKAITTKKMNKESGSTDQFKLQLTKGSDSFIARAKKIDTLNEAIVYHQMQENQDSLNSFLPTFVGVFNEKGEQIDLQYLLKKHTITEICKMEKYQSLYLVMNDLLETLSKDQNVEKIKTPKDFKFVRKSLQGSDTEADLHNRKKLKNIYKFVRKVFFSFSNCSFAFQQSTTSSWYRIIIDSIKRILLVRSTKSVLEKQFNRLPVDQLQKTKEKLEDLSRAIYSSNYAMADASLLFIPMQRKQADGQIINDLEIKLIDMTYAFSANELETLAPAAQHEHKKMKEEMQDSVEELIEMIGNILVSKQKS